MFRRLFQQAVSVWLACAGLVAVGAVAGVEKPLTPALSPSGGETGKSEPRYRVTRWTVENGLPQNSIKALAQTHDGYLWLGTLKGLARFDGVRFKVFDQSNTPEMTHDAINGLAVDAQDGGLWIGTGAGLFHYHDHRFERYGREAGIPGPVGPLCAAQAGGVWFSPQPGQVALARAGRVQTWDFGPDRPENTVHQLGEESAWTLLLVLGEPGGLQRIHRYDLIRKSLTRLSTPAGASWQAGHCLSFVQEADESLWLCTGQGIWRGSEKAWTQITSADAKSKVWPQRIYPTRGGQIWVTQLEDHRVSLQRLVAGRLEEFTAPEMPAEMNVTHVMEDREGNLWVGTMTGLFRLEPKRIRVYSRRDGLPSADTLAVTKGAGGTIWVGTMAGVSRIRGGKVEEIPPPGTNENWKSISVFLADRQNALWVGREENRLARFQQETWKTLPVPTEIGNTEHLKALYEDREGRMWISTGNGARCNEGGHWSYSSTSNGLSHGDVRVVYQDRRGDLWFGTYGGGLNRLKDGKFTTYMARHSERNNRMWWIHEDADGVFWVATEDGLNRFVPPEDSESKVQSLKSETEGEAAKNSPVTRHSPPVTSQGRFFTFTTQHGLGENVVNNIQEDEFGYLWLSGLRGIYRISRHELNDVAAGKREQVQCVAYGEADGMLNSECNGGDNQPAGCKDDQGRIWFPTAQGVVVIDPKEMQRTELPPPVVIEQVRANDQVVFGDGMIAKSRVQSPESKVGADVGLTPLLPDQFGNPQSAIRNLKLGPGRARVLEIHYTANSLVATERVRFKYRLEGHDREWLSDDQNRRVAFYTNLRPGDYTFQVTACNSHGAWNEQGDQFAFYVAPHFYETWPFYLACGAIVLSAGFGLHHRRIARLRRVQGLEQQRALHEERARIARDLHDDLGASLTGMALQLEAARRVGRAEGEQLAELAQEARGVAYGLRELSWATNPRCDNVGSLGVFLGELAERFCAAASLECKLELPPADNSQAVPARVRHDLLVLVKESLANVARHAGARSITLQVSATNGQLRLIVRDDGAGFESAQAQRGSGLQNLRERLEQAGGSFTAVGVPGQGAVITATVPLDEPKP